MKGSGSPLIENVIFKLLSQKHILYSEVSAQAPASVGCEASPDFPRARG